MAQAVSARFSGTSRENPASMARSTTKQRARAFSGPGAPPTIVVTDKRTYGARALPTAQHKGAMTVKPDKTVTFDLHPLYASILSDGDAVREGEVIGLDGDLRRVLIAPASGTIRLLVTGAGSTRRVKVFLTPRSALVKSAGAGR